jgi:hypothetical protein
VHRSVPRAAMVDDDRERELNAHSSLDEMLARETFGRSSSVGDDEIGDEAAWEFESDDESDDDDESRRRQLIQRSHTAVIKTPISSSANGVEDGAKAVTPPRTPAQRRLRELFGIPQEETLLVDYMCALHKKILLQGKMYVFENYICFHSNVFGYIKTRCIPFDRVTLINKAKTALLIPNAIEITWDGKTDFFTSFVFPDRTFRLVTDQWQKKSTYGKLFSVNNGQHIKTSKSSSKVKSDEDVEDVFKSPSADNGDDDDEEDEDIDSDEDDSPKDYGDVLMMIPSKMPEHEGTLTLIELQNCTMDCTVEEFFAALWSNKSRDALQMKVSEALEQTEVKISNWMKMKKSKTESMGCVREMHFTVPVRQTFGPSSTRCHQTQRYKYYSDSKLVINTSQVQTDIPYGDYFRVESRWLCRQLPDKKCSIWAGTEVKFSKSTMMKSLIVSSVIDESKVVFAKMIELLHDHLNPSLKKQASRKKVPEEVVDISKLDIPDASKDVIWNMLKPLKNFVEANSADTNVDLKGASPWRITCVYCRRGSRILALLLLVVLTHAVLSVMAKMLFGVILNRAFGMGAVDEATYWESKSKILTNELTMLERRVEFLVNEIEMTKKAFASASKK